MMNINIASSQAEGIEEVDLTVSDENQNGEPLAKVPKLVSSSVHKEFFQSKDEKGKWKSKCKHCTRKEKVYAHKNPTGLWEHLKKNHHEVYNMCKEKDDEEKEALKLESKRKQYPVQKGPSSSGHRPGSEAMFGPMNKFVTSQTQRNLPKWKKERIEKKFAYWISSSGGPVSSITENEDFHSFIAEIEPSLKLPRRTKVTNDCAKLAAEVIEKIKESLKSARRVALTTDIWSSTGCRNSFLGLTAHIFNTDTKRRENYCLACRQFDIAHTGENIGRLVVEILEEFGIRSKAFYCHSDNGSNVKRAFRLIGEGQIERAEDLHEVTEEDWDVAKDGIDEDDEVSMWESDSDEVDMLQTEELEIAAMADNQEKTDDEHREAFKQIGLKRLGCFPHTLQCAIMRSIKQKNSGFGGMLKKCRKLVAKYRKSPKAKAILRKTKFNKVLLGWCKTRWWSELTMLKRLVEAMECEVDELGENPLDILVDKMGWFGCSLTERHLRLMKAYIEVMEFIQTKSDLLGSEKFSTIHVVIPTIGEILAHLDKMSIKPLCKQFVGGLKTNIVRYFRNTMDASHKDYDPILFTATFLSPIHFHTLKEEGKKEAEENIKVLMEHYSANDEDVADTNTEHHGEGANQQGDPTEQRILIPGLAFLSDVILNKTQSAPSDISLTAALTRDLDKYKRRCQMVLNELRESAVNGVTKNPIDPLDFWVREMNSMEYETNIAKLAQDILVIPASSVPSERLFSISGLLSSGE